jgi:hypothetical protein
MPMHDWSRIPSGLFHHLHQDWSVEITRTLNRGRLPTGLSALIEQRVGAKEPDVLSIEEYAPREPATVAGAATMERPVTRLVRSTTKQIYATRANRIVIRHRLGRIVAVIEIVSPGNKESRAALRDFADKTIDFLRKGIHILIVDLFPPSPRDPFGIHKVIWDDITEEDFDFPEAKNRTLVSYDAGAEKIAYIETVGVGDVLPDMPLILTNDLHVMVPLEPTYQATWDASPEVYRHAVETGEMPNADGEAGD